MTLSTSRKERSTVVWERPDGVPDVCARFILARLNFDSESSASHDEMRQLDLFATQSKKSNNTIIKLDVCLDFHHDWLVVAYIEWLIN